MQTPPVLTSLMQQIMPYLVALIVLVLTSLGLLIKAWVGKIVAQLQENHVAAEAIAAKASTAASEAKAAAVTMVQHTTDAGKQLNQIQEKVDGAMSAMTEKADVANKQLLADKDAQIASLKTKRATDNQA